MDRVLTKTVTGPSLATETVTNSYDQARSGFFNAGQLTKAVKQRVLGIAGDGTVGDR